MPVNRIAREVLEAAADEQRRLRHRPTVQVNGSTVTRLRTDRIEYRGRVFRVRPISYPDGVRLQALNLRIEALADQPETPQELAALQVLIEECTILFRTFVTPEHWLDRILWPFLSNPFLNATEREVADLFGFFFYCRTNSTVRRSTDQKTTNSPTSI